MPLIDQEWLGPVIRLSEKSALMQEMANFESAPIERVANDKESRSDRMIRRRMRSTHLA